MQSRAGSAVGKLAGRVLLGVNVVGDFAMLMTYSSKTACDNGGNQYYEYDSDCNGVIGLTKSVIKFLSLPKPDRERILKDLCSWLWNDRNAGSDGEDRESLKFRKYNDL